MGHPDGAHTHGSGGSGIGAAAAVVLAAIVVASIAGPVVAAAVELLRVVLIAAAVLVGVGLLGGAALVAWRLRRGRQNAPLVVHQAPPVTRRPSQAVPAPQRPAIERSAETPRNAHWHLHIHGVDAETVARIIHRLNEGDQG